MRKVSAEKPIAKPTEKPSFFRYMMREIYRDKLALTSFIFLIVVFLFVYIAAVIIPDPTRGGINLMLMKKPPSAAHWLGTDPAGRDLLSLLIIGARNSFSIAIGVTLITSVFGILYGLVSGYYGGHTDNIMMRILDFMMMLPDLLFVIALISIMPHYDVFMLVAIISAFYWTGKARLIRAKTLQQRNLDYVSAAKTLGTSNLKILFGQVLPNINSIIIVNLTLNLAANMGLETGLTFLGFGLPYNTPSLGTLVGYGADPENLTFYPWFWLPASILIFVLMLSINFVGQAVKRAADTKQRLN